LPLRPRRSPEGIPRRRSLRRSPQMPKTPATKKQDLKAKPDHYLECREMGHRWKKLGYFHFRATHGQGVCRKSLCERCDTTRYNWYESDGARLWTEYEYPDHYLLQGTGRVLPKEVRREAIRRAAVFASEDMLDMTLTEGKASPARKAV
jgi:hypothetical protein